MAPGATSTARSVDQSDALLRRVVDRLPAMVAYWDADMRNVLANAAYRQWFGWDPSDMQGVHISEVLGAEVFALNLPHLEAALRGEEQLFERTLVDVDGAVRHTQASYVPEVVDGLVVGFFVLVTDVTPRVEAERALARSVSQYRALARSLPDAFVLVFDADQRFVIADGSALDAFEMTSAELEGRTLREALPDLADELEPRYARALAGETVRWDRVRSPRTFALTAGPIASDDGRIVAGMVICTDVTEGRRREATALALQQIAQTTADRSAPEDVFERVATSVRELLHADFAGVIRFDTPERGRVLTIVPEVPTPFGESPFVDLDDQSAVAIVAATGAPAIRRYDETSRGSARQVFASGMRIGAAAPIRVQGALWGAVAIGLQVVHEPDEEVVTRLAAFAELSALAVANAAEWEAHTRLAFVDPLTGVANRRAFDARLAEEIGRSDRDGVGVALAILDLDHFKAVNDTFGHTQGDLVLVEAGRRMSAAVREHELVARLGGEEFACILRCGDAESARRAAERLRLAIGEPPFPGGVVVSASIGVALRAPGEDVAALMARADRSLYDAKDAGRDTTRVALEA